MTMSDLGQFITTLTSLGKLPVPEVARMVKADWLLGEFRTSLYRQPAGADAYERCRSVLRELYDQLMAAELHSDSGAAPVLQHVRKSLGREIGLES
jgi:hypothetical protein